MKKNHISELTQELREIYPELDSVSEYKIAEALRSLKEIQKSSFPQAQFKKKLFNRLKTLGELKLGDSMYSGKKTFFSRLSFFSGIFASFLFIGAFLFFMRDSLFQSNFTTPTIYESQTVDSSSPEISLEYGDVPQAVQNIVQDPDSQSKILREEDVIFQGTPSTTVKKVDTSTVSPSGDQVPTNTQTTDSLLETSMNQTQDFLPEEPSLLEESKLQKTPDIFPADLTSSTETSAKKTSESTENNSFSDPVESSSDMMGDMMLQNQVYQSIYTFADFCRDSFGVLTGDIGNQVCKKEKKSCTQAQYETGMCDIEEYLENNTEILIETPIQEPKE